MVRIAVRLFSAFLLLAAGALLPPTAASSAATSVAPPVPRAALQAGVGGGGGAAPAPRSTESLARLLPDGALASVHVPSGLAVWDCPAAREARALAQELGLLAELEKAAGVIQLATRTDPEQTLRFLLGGELAAAVYEGSTSRLSASDHKPRELLALSRTTDADGLKLALDALLAAAARDHDVKHQQYRERPYARLDHKLLVAAVDGVLVATTDDDLLAGVLDRALDGTPAPTRAPTDAPAGELAPGETTLATFSLDTERLQPADLRPVEQSGRRLLGKRVANPLANLLFGGLTLGEGRIDGALVSRERGLSVRATLPAPPADAPAAWFPPGADSFAVPTTPETLAVLRARRDLGDWWRQRATLLSEDSQPGLAKADENIGVLFAGSSPAEDVFGRVAPELALVIDRQRFEGTGPTPEVRLPGFCLVGRLRDAPDFAGNLGVAFQSFVSFLNTDRAQDGRAPFLLDVQVHEGVSVRTAKLLPRAGEDAASLGLDANWSPAVAVADDWLLIGSSAEQVRRLITALHGKQTTARDATLGFDLDVAAAIGLAREDRAALAANRMLEEGADAEAAGRDIDNFLRLASRLARLSGDVRRDGHGLRLDVTLALAPEAATAPAPAAGPAAR